MGVFQGAPLNRICIGPSICAMFRIKKRPRVGGKLQGVFWPSSQPSGWDPRRESIYAV